MSELQHLSQAIQHLETQRPVLGDQVVDSALVPLQERMAEIEHLGGFPELQRKQVTILYVDIAGSTAMIQHLDPEDNRDIIDGALQRMSIPITEHNGHVTRFRGDGFKAVFGTPQAHEHDPEQAVRAGLAIQETARQLAEELSAMWDIQDFQVRVGINTGLVAVGGWTEAEDTIMGSTVNLAKRIEDQAPSGGVLISHDTYRHVRGVFDIKPLEPITAKGFDQEIPVYQVIRAKTRSLGFNTLWVEGIETRMVGRDSELNILQQARQNLILAGRGEMITVHGEAGIGKSRLVFEYRSWEETLQDYIWVFLGRGRQDIQHQPYAMWRELFAYRFEIYDTDPNRVVIQKLETGFGKVFGQGESSRMRAHFIGQLLGFDCSRCTALKGVLADPGQLREQATRYLVEYFSALTSKEPAYILVEDLHWVDDRSLDLLEQLGDITLRRPFLIICVTRNVFFEFHPQWGQGQDYQKILKLDTLTVAESEQLVAEILQKVASIPDELRDLVVGQAEGNPFYIEELIKMLIEIGVILPGEDAWRITSTDLDQVQVPSTLTGVLQARLDALPAGERHLLQLAAVFGKDFWDLAVQQVSEARKAAGGFEVPVDTRVQLPSLIQRELIFGRGESVFAGTRQFTFKHVLFRDVVYETIPKRERATYHGLTADWLVAVTQTNMRSEEYAAVIAGHYLSAGSPIYASDWFFRAGQRAKTQVAMREARNYLEQSLALLPESDQYRHCQILFELDEVLGILGDQEARSASDDELIRLSQELQDDNLLARAYYRQAFYFNARGKYQDELAAHEKALAAARRAGNREIEANILGLKVVCLTFLGDLQAAHECADRAVSYARELGDDDTLAKVLGNAFTYYQLVDISQAEQLIKESIEILDHLGNHNMKATSLINLGYIYTHGLLPARGGHLS